MSEQSDGLDLGHLIQPGDILTDGLGRSIVLCALWSTSPEFPGWGPTKYELNILWHLENDVQE